MNWDALHEYVEQFCLQEQPNEFVAFCDGIEMEDGPLQWCAAWLHAGDLMGKPELDASAN